MKKLLIALMLLGLLCAAMPALAEESALKFDKNVNTVGEGETLQTVLDRTGEAAEGKVTYTSSDKKLATVDADGVITGISKGQVTITATVKGASKAYKAQLPVVVYRKAASIEIDAGKLTVLEPDDGRLTGVLEQGTEHQVLILPLGKEYPIQANVLPSSASNRRTVMESADETVLKVKNGKIAGVKAGETELVIANEANEEVNTTYHVLVVNPVKKIKLTPASPVAAVGGTLSLGAEITPVDAGFPQLSWKSMDEHTATVDENGVVTALKRGSVKIVATAMDGSNAKAEVSVKVNQMASGISLNSDELTINVGKNHSVKATVLPENTNNKKVVWTSSDDSIAQVNANGRVTGVSIGTCEITCTSAENPEASASVTVHVQQPVTKISFTSKEASVYLGKSLVLGWTVEPANATNPGVTLISSDKRILTVADDGTVTPVKAGEATVTATTVDGSERKARIKVKVLQPVEGVHMENSVAYIEVNEKANVRAVLEPSNASNHNMTWGSVDPGTATVTGEKVRATVTGHRHGQTTIIGTTEDGGFQTSFVVNVGNWDHMVSFRSFDIGGKANPLIKVRNDGSWKITNITVELTFFDENGDPFEANTKNGSNVITAVYRKSLAPGKTTTEHEWELKNYSMPADPFYRVTARLISFRFDGWTKNIMKKNVQKKTWTRSW